MKTEQKKTTLLVIALLVILAIGGYVVTRKSGSSESLLTKESGATSGVSNGVVAADTLLMIDAINAIATSTSVFEHPTFLKLNDISVPVQAEGVGRNNPFAPF